MDRHSRQIFDDRPVENANHWVEKEMWEIPSIPRLPVRRVFSPQMVNNCTMKRHSNDCKNQLVNHVCSAVQSGSETPDDTQTQKNNIDSGGSEKLEIR